MQPVKTIAFSALVLLLAITACSQDEHERTKSGEAYARKVLMNALAGKAQHNVIDNKRIIIRDSAMAVGVAEPVLFSLYGKDNIIWQRPYEVYLVDNYWIIWGTLPKDYLGGTFLIILNATNGSILRMTHGK